MKTSEAIDKLSPAYVAAQSELKNATFDKANSHFKNKYATLSQVRDTVTPVLAKHGLAVIQGADLDCIVTRLVHDSGQWIESRYPFALDKPQNMGSAMTYARRYCLSAMCNIASEEDDDGNAAQQSSSSPIMLPTPQTTVGTDAKVLPANEARALYKDLVAEIHELKSDAGIAKWESENASRISKLGAWSKHITEAINDHVNFLLTPKQAEPA